MARERHWEDDANCIGQPDYAFGDDETKKGDTQKHLMKLIRRVCAPCPVKGPCLKRALIAEEGDRVRYGVWGGMTPHERRRLVEKVGQDKALALSETM